MKYLIFFLLALLVILFSIFIYFKKISSRSKFIMPNSKPKKPIYKSVINENLNPSFEVELIDYKKNQFAISKCALGEAVIFKIAKNKRINVYTTNKLYLGQIAIKDYKNFSLISKKANFFEGEIYSFNKENINIKKVIISIRAKLEYSKEIYYIDKNYLNTLITLFSLFTEDEIIETNYGPSTIIKVYEDHLLVEVPSLGNREIYDINSILKSKK